MLHLFTCLLIITTAIINSPWNLRFLFLCQNLSINSLKCLCILSQGLLQCSDLPAESPWEAQRHENERRIINVQRMLSTGERWEPVGKCSVCYLSSTQFWKVLFCCCSGDWTKVLTHAKQVLRGILYKLPRGSGKTSLLLIAEKSVIWWELNGKVRMSSPFSDHFLPSFCFLRLASKLTAAMSSV
jgi:hypothetical protein